MFRLVEMLDIIQPLPFSRLVLSPKELQQFQCYSGKLIVAENQTADGINCLFALMYAIILV
jgi:hypothetical protein